MEEKEMLNKLLDYINKLSNHFEVEKKEVLTKEEYHTMTFPLVLEIAKFVATNK
jgi:hypothetical protein